MLKEQRKEGWQKQGDHHKAVLYIGNVEHLKPETNQESIGYVASTSQ